MSLTRWTNCPFIICSTKIGEANYRGTFCSLKVSFPARLPII
jgi:hypothetical protein